MNNAILDEGGTVMQFVGDAVMACSARRCRSTTTPTARCAAAQSMLDSQRALNERWLAASKAPFGIGIGISTGAVAAAMLGSEERVEYTLVGDTVNLAQRLQDLARPSGRIVINESTLTRRCAPSVRVRAARRDDGQGAEHAGAGVPHRRVRRHGTEEWQDD